MHIYNKYLLVLTLIFLIPVVCFAKPGAIEYRSWIVDMKESPKGPFIRVLWYCNDGEILLPTPYACKEHDGGHQHGKLNDKALSLRNNGYWIANLLAGIDPKKILARDDFVDWYSQLLIEKFLIRTDNGWILKKALFYRGAIQEEDERYGARILLTALAEKNEWIKRRYSALRTGVQLLPHGQDSASIQKVRQLSVSLSEQDEAFINLRTKIHVSPDAEDARLVREYATKIRDRQQQAKYMELAQEIDRVFQSPPLHKLLERNAKTFSREPWLQQLLLEASKAYHSDNSARNHYAVTARLLADLRDALPKIRKSSSRLRILDLSLAVEVENFRVSTQLKSTLTKVNRLQRISWLRDAALATYGTGLINQRSLEALLASISRMEYEQLSLNTYFNELKYLSRTPGWSTQELRFQFYPSMMKLAEIEPLASLFIQDVLRGSPMLFFSQILDSLSRDANKLAGATHKIFDREIGLGFHALNPGLARGKLYTKIDFKNPETFDSQGIYLLPETVADLPPVAGIITVGEGNSLSHIQLLARNLGIPNITVNQNLLEQLQNHDGETIVMAVSPNGLVELNGDSEYWREFFNSKSSQQQTVIRPDLEKLDLAIQEMIGLDSLRASDSGRIVGPKAAKLGELYYHYPGKVAKGFAIPFGVFRKTVLDAPYKKTDQTVFEWMESQYVIIHALPVNSEQRKQMTESFRTEIYDIIINTDIGDQNRNNIRKAMFNNFGNTETGVFIRSDTNVEDLPGFTGAGLNLTLFNIVGIDNIFKGISKVWASPFTARAFSWRQSLMESPQHVYPAILLMQTVANDKSGVMITEDIDTNKKGVLSVATNEGVGGAVDGQSAESLRIDTEDGKVLLLATASAPFRKVPSPEGGIAKVPVSDSETVLTSDEISQLIQFSKELPDTFPPITDENNNPVPADIEFGFFNGKLQLFQLRPFLQSKKVQASSYLKGMDKALQSSMNRLVIMSEIPE